MDSVRELKSTRQGFGKALLELGKKNKKVVVLSADLTSSVQAHKFEEKYPTRFFQAGVAEQNMISMATGLSLESFIPFATSFGVFVPMRCLDQIRVSVCYNNSNVKLVGSHCGLSTGEDGATHQALEDVASLRSLPNMTIIEPCDYNQTILATKAIVNMNGPAYLRIHRPKMKQLTKTSSKFKIGKADIIQKGEKLTIITSGPVLVEVIKASKILVKEKIINFKPEIINCHTIKPIDYKTIINSVKKTNKVLVIQDHQIVGGLGSSVCEVLSQHFPAPVKILGMKDKFGESGSPKELWHRYGLDHEGIMREIKKFV